MVSGMFWMLLLLEDLPGECLREIMMASEMCLDPGMGHILTTTNATSASFSTDFGRKK